MRSDGMGLVGSKPLKDTSKGGKIARDARSFVRSSHEENGLDITSNRLIVWQQACRYQCFFDHDASKTVTNEDLRTFCLLSSRLNVQKSFQEVLGKVLDAGDGTAPGQGGNITVRPDIGVRQIAGKGISKPNMTMTVGPSAEGITAEAMDGNNTKQSIEDVPADMTVY